MTRAIKAKTIAARLDPDSFPVPDVELGLAEDEVLVLPVPEDVKSRSITYISPVASEATKSRPLLSKAIPTGRRQFCGHAALSAFPKISVVAVLLSDAATGSPFAKGILDSL